MIRLKLIIIFLTIHSILYSQNLKVVTFNVWSGLNYEGTFKMGEYESATRRELRYQNLIAQLKTENPDVVFLQEANPADEYAEKIADALGYDEIHQVCNAGFKVGQIGIPSNLKEGNVILAKRKLGLVKYDVLKLSGSLGINGDAINMHADESIYAIVGKIKINDVPIYLINIHLFAAIPANREIKSVMRSFLDSGLIKKDQFYNLKIKLHDRYHRQVEEINKLKNYLKDLPKDVPIIIAGDFNSEQNSDLLLKFISDAKLMDTHYNGEEKFTWNPKINENIEISSLTLNSKRHKFNAYDSLWRYYDLKQKKIDHIFLNELFTEKDIINAGVCIDAEKQKIHSSDHFGYSSNINFSEVLKKSLKESDEFKSYTESEIEPFPIVNYDSDAGFGYGGKIFILNKLKMSESFDLILFNSTKGERWYRFIYSLPDFELRQGKKYPLSADLLVDYDKWINNSFFGIGNTSKKENREYYTKEPLEISLTLGKGISKSFVSQLGLKYKTIMNSNFSDSSTLKQLSPNQNQGKANSQSFFVNLRYDNRNSFINPSTGNVIQLEFEVAPKLSYTNTKFSKLSVLLQSYSIPFYPKTIFANRLMFQSIFGSDIPIQVLNSIGGNNTLRGYNQDRYIDKVSLVFNSELRFPIIWRFGGIIGLDAGNVWNAISKMSIRSTLVDGVVGLRFYMDTFIIRFDLGFSKETTGIYFNFGQIF